MKKIFFILIAMIVASAPTIFAQDGINQTPLSITGTVFTQEARDWHGFHKFHEHVEGAIREVEIARRAGHYGMAGQGRKAEDFLRQAEEELRMANNSTNIRQSDDSMEKEEKDGKTEIDIPGQTMYSR